jgi:hypothetical protein
MLVTGNHAYRLSPASVFCNASAFAPDTSSLGPRSKWWGSWVVTENAVSGRVETKCSGAVEVL